MIVRHHIQLTSEAIALDGQLVSLQQSDEDLLRAVYHQKIGGYPKFYKMDLLSRLGFVASELILMAEGRDSLSVDGREDRAVILFGDTGSVNADQCFQNTISADNYFPSPSVFVYTLPNIVTGEIALRNHYYGETVFYLLPEKDISQMQAIVSEAFFDSVTTSALCGWLSAPDELSYDAELWLIDK